MSIDVDLTKHTHGNVLKESRSGTSLMRSRNYYSLTQGLCLRSRKSKKIVQTLLATVGNFSQMLSNVACQKWFLS